LSGSYHLWLIPLLPLAGAAINGLLGRGRPRSFVSAVGVGSVSLACAYAFLTFLRFPWHAGHAYVENVAPWVVAGNLQIDFSLYLDPLSAVMVAVVTGVGLLIHIYSVGYMAHDPGYYRFFSYLNLFTFFMLTLVLAGNFLLMFVGWEGVGLCSYLLIGYWFTKKSAADAGKKAFIVNRVGDFGFTLAVISIYWLFGGVEFEQVFGAVAAMPAEAANSIGPLTWICLLLLMGAAGKSAQLPLYVWLPDAMEGPTPVSALIHAATMVTAGVYMVARSGVLFMHAPLAMTAVAIVGAATALFSATIGVTQTDIKRVLAYSTISQLGYMFLACGVGAFTAGIFHLMTHSFFKALLFLGAGSVIHAIAGEQDMRKMGGLRQAIPWTYGTFLAAALAIAGIFPLSGFVSKDAILWKASPLGSPSGSWLYWLVGLATAGLTAFYVFRLFFLTFHGEPRSEAVHHAHESPRVMLAPLAVLAFLSVVGGFVGWPKALGGHDRFEAFLAPVFRMAEESAPAAHAAEEHAALEIGFSLLAVGVAALGIGLAWLLYVARPRLAERTAERLGALYRLVLNKYYVDEAYDFAIVRPLVVGSTRLLWRAIDVGVIDGAVDGVAQGARNIGGSARRLQSGNIRSYASWVLAGAVLVVSFMTFLWAK
jgi:NADH-quinone oxidoreductase subunit L